MRKRGFCCDYITEPEHFEFKNWHQPFSLKSNLNCETPNLTYVIISSGCNKECIAQTGGQLKDRLNIYRKHIRQLEYEKIKLRTCAMGIFKFFPFCKMKENNKTLREFFEDNFIKNFKPVLNQRL